MADNSSDDHISSFTHPTSWSSARAQQKWQLQELHKISEDHMQHDLQESDRELLKQASKKVPFHYAIGTALGVGLGVLVAFRVRQARLRAFQAFVKHEKPVEVKFENGRTEPIPDITPYVRPTTAGDIFTYGFFGLSGFFLGGQIGLLTGSSAAVKTIDSDAQAKRRIMEAFRRFRVDVLKRQLKELEGSKSSVESLKDWVRPGN